MTDSIGYHLLPVEHIKSTCLNKLSDYVVDVDGTGASIMLTAVESTVGGTRGAVGNGTTGIEMAVSTFALEDFICGCSTLLSLSLSAFRAICL